MATESKMTLGRFHEWARRTAAAQSWSLDLVTTERDGVPIQCEAWFCKKDDTREDTAQGYWKLKGDDGIAVTF